MAEAFEGLSDSFTQGLQIGQQNAMKYAGMASELDLKRQHLEVQKQQLEATKQERNTQVGQLFFNELDKITNMKEGNAKNARIKIMQQKGAELGMGNMDMLAAMLKDEDGVANMRALLSNLNAMNPEQRTKALAKAHEFLGSDEIYDYVKSWNSTAADMLKTQQAKDLEARNDARKNKNKGQDPELTRNLSKDVESVAKDLSRWIVVSKGVDRLVRNKDGVVDFNKMTGAEDIQLLKSYLQFNDTPRVTEGETQAVQAAQATLDKAAAWLSKVQKGEVLSPALREEIYNATTKLTQVFKEARKDQLSPFVKQAQANGIPMDRLFGPKLQKEITEEIPNWQPIQGTAGAPAPGEAQGIPLVKSAVPGPRPSPSPSPMAPAQTQSRVQGQSPIPPQDDASVYNRYLQKTPEAVTEAQRVFGLMGGDEKRFLQKVKGVVPDDLAKAIVAVRGKKKTRSK